MVVAEDEPEVEKVPVIWRKTVDEAVVSLTPRLCDWPENGSATPTWRAYDAGACDAPGSPDRVGVYCGFDRSMGGGGAWFSVLALDE